MVDSKNRYWAGQTELQMTTLDAWIALAEQRPEEAVSRMRAAATAEEASDKHPVAPGSVVPSRELLGEMLLGLAGRWSRRRSSRSRCSATRIA